MLTIEQLRHLLAQRNLAEVSREAGIHYNTVYRVAKGNGLPDYNTVKALSDYLTGVAQ